MGSNWEPRPNSPVRLGKAQRLQRGASRWLEKEGTAPPVHGPGNTSYRASGHRLDSIDMNQIACPIQSSRHSYALPHILLHLLLVVQFVRRGVRNLQGEAV